MRKIILFIAILLCIITAVVAVQESNNSKIETRNVKIQLNKNQAEQQKLEDDYNKLKSANAGNEQKVQELEQKRQQLEKEKSDLETQLQAKAELRKQNLVYAAAAPTVPFTQRSTAEGCQTGVTSENYALNQLIQHESSGNSCAENSGGCFGLLQACPGAPLKAECGGNVACQLDWYTRIKLPRHGTWEKAWAFWLARVPINGRDVGNWW